MEDNKLYQKLNLATGHSRRHLGKSPWPILIIFIIIAIVIAYASFSSSDTPTATSTPSQASLQTTANESIEAEPSVDESSVGESESTIAQTAQEILETASLLAASYDYDAAIELIASSDPIIASSSQATEAIAQYESIKSTLVRQNLSEITHVFFHTLIIDTSKAFDGDYRESGYNQVMTTKDEFVAILNEMYERGFVLVGLHDMAEEVTDPETGETKMTAKDIYLPPDKKAFVMSQDDVCYYEYMEGDGFARNLVIGEDGRVTCEYVQDDGSVVQGDYDLIPILNKFIDEHPDFSYRGAKAVIAVTGYNGVFGYRTAPDYEESNPNIEADRQTVRQIAQALRDDGWELASHSWGHRNFSTDTYEQFVTDSNKWRDQVESLIGETDIILFPFGSDIADWHPYTEDNEKYSYLLSLGFRYFCNVDSSQYYVQITDRSLRQGRRNLDGYRMWRDITEPENTRLSDLFDANEIFDSSRPTPVPPMS